MAYNRGVMWHLSIALLAAVAQNPRQPEVLSPGTAAGEVAISTANDASAALWLDSATQSVQVSYADGRGVQWAPPVTIDGDLSGAAKAVTSRCLAASASHIHAVWMDDRNGATDAYWTTSADGGVTWGTPQRLDDGYIPGMQAVTDLQVVADNNYVYVAMRVQAPAGTEDIMMASSMDYGATWNATLKANAMMADCDGMAICCEDLNVFVTWADDRHTPGMDDVFLRMSHDGGANWMMTMMDEQIDSSGIGVGNAEGDRLQISGGMMGLVVAWMENHTATTGADCELHVRYSPDGGHLWPIPEATLATGADVSAPSLVVDPATICVAWQDDRSGSEQIYAAVSKDYSLSWTEHSLTSSGGAQPSVGGYADLWAVSWLENPATPRAQMAVSRDGGMNFLAPIALQTSDAELPQLSYNSRYENFVAAWIESPSAARSVHAGGVRSQSLRALSPGFAVGDPIHFEVDHFPTADAGTPFAVLLSSATGSYRLPFGDGRNTGLLDNPYQPAYLSLLSGTIDFAGHGTTPTLTVPNTPGATWYATGLAYLASAHATYLLRLTDVVEIQVQ